MDNTRIIQALFGRVGWRETNLAGYAVIDAANKTANSGRYFQDFHAAVTVQNLQDTQEANVITDEAFNAYLKTMQESAIHRLVSAVFDTPERIEQIRLFDRDYRGHVLQRNAGRFVGIKFKTSPYDHAITVNKILLNFNQAIADLKLYCFHDAQVEPVWTKNVAVLADSQTVIEVDNLEMSHWKHNGGFYYLGYFQNDLGEVQAYDLAASRVNVAFTFGHHYFSAQPSGPERMDKASVIYTASNYGINAEVSASSDPTNMITANARAFDEGIGLQMAVMTIEQILHSNRINQVKRISGEQLKQLYTDLNLAIPVENVPFTPGLRVRLQKEVEKIKRNFKSKELIKTTLPPCYS